MNVKTNAKTQVRIYRNKETMKKATAAAVVEKADLKTVRESLVPGVV